MILEYWREEGLQHLRKLEPKNGFVKIKKLEFDLDKAIKEIEKLKREKLLLSDISQLTLKSSVNSYLALSW